MGGYGKTLPSALQASRISTVDIEQLEIARFSMWVAVYLADTPHLSASHSHMHSHVHSHVRSQHTAVWRR